MSSAILLNDSNPVGVTESSVVEVAASPPARIVGSNTPRTSISLPKMSAIEWRYSCSVRRRRLTTYESSLDCAATIAAPPQIANASAKAARIGFRTRNPMIMPSMRSTRLRGHWTAPKACLEQACGESIDPGIGGY